MEGCLESPHCFYYASWETLLWAGHLFSLQLWMQNQEEALHGEILLLCLHQPHCIQMECSSAWKSLWASISKRGSSTRPPKAEFSRS